MHNVQHIGNLKSDRTKQKQRENKGKTKYSCTEKLTHCWYS